MRIIINYLEKNKKQFYRGLIFGVTTGILVAFIFFLNKQKTPLRLSIIILKKYDFLQNSIEYLNQ